MREHGFIRDMLDVKVLILYVLSQAETPMSFQNIYELCYQDDRLTYFDVCEAIPQLVESGHASETKDGLVEITEKGRETAEITADSVAFPVRERAKAAVEEFNQASTRSGHVRTEILEQDGSYIAMLELRDDLGKLISMEITAPNKKQARKLAASFHKCAEQLYSAVMEDLLSEID